MNNKTAKYLREVATLLTQEAAKNLQQSEELDAILYKNFYKGLKKARTKKVLDKDNILTVLANLYKFGYLIREPIM